MSDTQVFVYVIYDAAMIEIDGAVQVEHETEGMVTLSLAAPATSAGLEIGTAVACKLIPDSGDDRYFGTILSIVDDTTVVLLLDRVAMVMQVGKLVEDKSPFTPTRGTGEHNAGVAYS